VGQFAGVGAALVRELGGQTGAGDLGPSLEGLGTGGAVLAGGDVVSAEVEEVGNGGVDRDEALNVAGRLEPFHLAFSSAGRLVGVFRPVVEPFVLAVLDESIKICGVTWPALRKAVLSVFGASGASARLMPTRGCIRRRRSGPAARLRAERGSSADVRAKLSG
jgi:hypothetical protein